jgi:hypothetical protein
MIRPVLLVLIILTAAFAIPRSSSAQEVYMGGYGSTALPSFPADNGYGYIIIQPRAPRATHDSRIDPHLLRAARIAEAHAFPHSTLRCWRYVKNALLEAGAVGDRPTTNYACEAGDELTSRYGFIRLPISNPYRAPVGSILVYRGGYSGHVEIRTEHGFASDYHSAWACRYHLLGVYAKLST